MELPDNLVLKAKQGDPEAFALIYDEYAQKLFRYIRMKVQNLSECEDVLQDVFIKAWHGLPKFEAKEGNFNAWIYRIATNSINDYFRKKYRRPETVELVDTFNFQANDSPVEDLTKSMDTEFLHKTLMSLPVFSG